MFFKYCEPLINTFRNDRHGGLFLRVIFALLLLLFVFWEVIGGFLLLSCHSRNLQSGIQVFASSFDFFGGYEEALPPQSIETLRGDKQGDKAIPRQ